jgi:NTP pyrophosphatase (non-canonical NTP hydrolase)
MVQEGHVMSDADTTVLALRQRVEDFVRAREWERHHRPKELASAIAIEAAELMELFLWMEQPEADETVRRPESRRRIEEELADVVIYCLSLANRLEIDLADTVLAKVKSNEAKYPAESVRGKPLDYTRRADGS